RALKLGFEQIEVHSPERPLCCRDERRTYLWMPLDSSTAPRVRQPRKEEQTPVPENNNHKPPPSDGTSSAIDPLAEAEAVRSLLAEGAAGMGRLIGSLKSFRKQSKVVSAALRSLRELPPLPQ